MPARSQASLLKELGAVMDRDENKLCADCPKRNPVWACIILPPVKGGKELGVFCCTKCYKYHQKLGTRLSVVKSTSMATQWTEEELEIFSNTGNEIVNSVLEAKLVDDLQNPKEIVTHSREEEARVRMDFATKKYRDLKYFSKAAYDKVIADVRADDEDEDDRKSRLLPETYIAGNTANSRRDILMSQDASSRSIQSQRSTRSLLSEGLLERKHSARKLKIERSNSNQDLMARLNGVTLEYKPRPPSTRSLMAKNENDKKHKISKGGSLDERPKPTSTRSLMEDTHCDIHRTGSQMEVPSLLDATEMTLKKAKRNESSTETLETEASSDSEEIGICLVVRERRVAESASLGECDMRSKLQVAPGLTKSQEPASTQKPLVGSHYRPSLERKSKSVKNLMQTRNSGSLLSPRNRTMARSSSLRGLFPGGQSSGASPSPGPRNTKRASSARGLHLGSNDKEASSLKRPSGLGRSDSSKAFIRLSSKNNLSETGNGDNVTDLRCLPNMLKRPASSGGHHRQQISPKKNSLLDDVQSDRKGKTASHTLADLFGSDSSIEYDHQPPGADNRQRKLEKKLSKCSLMLGVGYGLEKHSNPRDMMQLPTNLGLHSHLQVSTPESILRKSSSDRSLQKEGSSNELQVFKQGIPAKTMSARSLASSPRSRGNTSLLRKSWSGRSLHADGNSENYSEVQLRRKSFTGQIDNEKKESRTSKCPLRSRSDCSGSSVSNKESSMCSIKNLAPSQDKYDPDARGLVLLMQDSDSAVLECCQEFSKTTVDEPSSASASDHTVTDRNGSPNGGNKAAPDVDWVGNIKSGDESSDNPKKSKGSRSHRASDGRIESTKRELKRPSSSSGLKSSSANSSHRGTSRDQLRKSASLRRLRKGRSGSKKSSLSKSLSNLEFDAGSDDLLHKPSDDKENERSTGEKSKSSKHERSRDSHHKSSSKRSSESRHKNRRRGLEKSLSVRNHKDEERASSFSKSLSHLDIGAQCSNEFQALGCEQEKKEMSSSGSNCNTSSVGEKVDRHENGRVRSNKEESDINKENVSERYEHEQICNDRLGDKKKESSLRRRSPRSPRRREDCYNETRHKSEKKDELDGVSQEIKDFISTIGDINDDGFWLKMIDHWERLR